VAESNEDSDQEKTEEPSQYRLDEFRKKGDVAYSRELNSVLLLSGTLLTAILGAVYIYEVFDEYLSWLLKQDFQKIYEKNQLVEVVTHSAWVAFKCVAPIFGVSMAIGFLSQFMQIGFIYSPELLGINFDRINPINGFQRIFSKKSLSETVKSLLKFFVVIFITYRILSNHAHDFLGFLHVDATEALGYGKVLMIKLGFSILLGLGIVAILDFAWEKFTYRQKLMMTKQDAKQEAKEKDGNPEVKNRIRQIQRQMARKRMMNDVKKADVIVTNPTHISVALKYDGEKMVAPALVAKGADHLALKIREIAQENDIPIVENILLARTLYKTVKVGEGVPRTLYRAVAEILAFVYKLKRKKKALGS
jgi:flagellar biosynthetic protein FlhB